MAPVWGERKARYRAKERVRNCLSPGNASEKNVCPVVGALGRLAGVLGRAPLIGLRALD